MGKKISEKVVIAICHKKDFDLLAEKLNRKMADLYLFLENYFISRKDIVKLRREKIKKFNKK